MKFNLIDEPWLPCVLPNGKLEERSLREVLVHAHEIRELHEDSPLAWVAMHRLLLAVLHRVFGPRDRSAWRALWTAGHFDSSALDLYLDKWRSRFDLLSETHPFMQEAGFNQPGVQSSTVHPLFVEAPAGDGPTLFDHRTEAAPERPSLAVAARHLLAFQSFALPGRIKGVEAGDSARAGLLYGAASVMVAGDSLFESLALNMVCPEHLHAHMPGAVSDLPTWEASPTEYRRDQPPTGLAHAFSWRARRVLLHAEGNRIVGAFYAGEGDRRPENFIDPMVPVVSDPKIGRFGLALRPHKAVWRESAAILLADEKGLRCLPALTMLDELVSDGLLEGEHLFRLEAAGFAKGDNAAKVLLWRRERLPLPIALLREPVRQLTLSLAIETAEGVSRALYGALAELARYLLVREADHDGAREALKSDVNKLVDATYAQGGYWSVLGAAFPFFVRELSADPDVAFVAWQRAVASAAREALDGAAALHGSQVRGIKAGVRARGVLERKLREHCAVEPIAEKEERV